MYRTPQARFQWVSNGMLNIFAWLNLNSWNSCMQTFEPLGGEFSKLGLVSRTNMSSDVNWYYQSSYGWLGLHQCMGKKNRLVLWLVQYSIMPWWERLGTHMTVSRESWERGQPDFNGAASFDNILKKVQLLLSSLNNNWYSIIYII